MRGLRDRGHFRRRDWLGYAIVVALTIAAAVTSPTPVAALSSLRKVGGSWLALLGYTSSQLAAIAGAPV